MALFDLNCYVLDHAYIASSVGQILSSSLCQTHKGPDSYLDTIGTILIVLDLL